MFERREVAPNHIVTKYATESDSLLAEEYNGHIQVDSAYTQTFSSRAQMVRKLPDGRKITIYTTRVSLSPTHLLDDPEEGLCS